MRGGIRPRPPLCAKLFISAQISYHDAGASASASSCFDPESSLSIPPSLRTSFLLSLCCNSIVLPSGRQLPNGAWSPYNRLRLHYLSFVCMYLLIIATAFNLSALSLSFSPSCCQLSSYPPSRAAYIPPSTSCEYSFARDFFIWNHRLTGVHYRSWIFFSSVTILFNKYILSNLDFRKHPAPEIT